MHFSPIWLCLTALPIVMVSRLSGIWWSRVQIFNQNKTNNQLFIVCNSVIGGWQNTQSVIRLSKQGLNKVTVSTVGVTSNTEYREYHISFGSNLVEVSEVGNQPFMSYKNPNGFDVSYIGISTGWGSEGIWEFCGFGKHQWIIYW